MRKLLLELVLLLLVLLFVRGGMQELAQSGKPPCLAELQTQAPRDSNFGQRALKAWSAQWSSWLGAPQAAREVLILFFSLLLLLLFRLPLIFFEHFHDQKFLLES